MGAPVDWVVANAIRSPATTEKLLLVVVHEEGVEGVGETKQLMPVLEPFL